MVGLKAMSVRVLSRDKGPINGHMTAPFVKGIPSMGSDYPGHDVGNEDANISNYGFCWGFKLRQQGYTGQDGKCVKTLEKVEFSLER